ncbi:MAG: FixH family protein [Proteobacteria bacterium]|nr:FixH family protein [Pseudomonadota bacterium]
MSRYSIYFLIIFFIFNSYANSKEKEKNKVFDLKTNRGSFYVKFIFLDSRITTGNNNAILEIYDKDRNPVKSAKVEILLWMNEHGHYSSSSPVIKERETGIYEVTKLDFEMRGKWEVIVNLKKDNLKDKVSFEVLVE